METQGELPPKPEALGHLEFNIDPQISILGMRYMLLGIARVFCQIGIGALHNMTDLSFLTSDNPMIWFDPSVPEAKNAALRVAREGTDRLALPCNFVCDDLRRFIDA